MGGVLTLAKRIIPCLDVRDGRVVKGVRFKGLKDVGDPAECAAAYQTQGADEIVFLDITATIEGRALLKPALQRTAEDLFVPLTVGGGIRDLKDIAGTLRAGADKVSLNTAALEDPALLTAAAEMFGSQCVVLAIDAKRADGGWEVYSHAGTRATGRDAVAWARDGVRRGAGEILLTSMDADGTKAGYDLLLTKAVAAAVKVPVIASGGCGRIEHIHEVLTKTRAQAALAASIFHYGTHTVAEVKRHLKRKGVAVRA